MNQLPLSDQLHLFQEEFNYTKIRREEDHIVCYRIPTGYAHELVLEANKLILKLGLDLVAKSNSANGIFADTMIIVSK